ncbi:hypothetical protein CTEST_08345 [Corynebacterium testudinoris]|uniref:Uncharacterized protein n=1 Tax=Corynebacterium testudinoris TaxID=136857 RepID=A0A0G3H6V1_9CORY|nr:hypothetical protein CTEST_08345 [Corynebacterium testudinoris]
MAFGSSAIHCARTSVADDHPAEVERYTPERTRARTDFSTSRLSITAETPASFA